MNPCLVGVILPLAPPPEGVGRALTGFVVRGGAGPVARIVSPAAGAAAVHVVAAVPVNVARWQNLIPSFPWIAPVWRVWGAQSMQGKEGIKFCSVA